MPRGIPNKKRQGTQPSPNSENGTVKPIVRNLAENYRNPLLLAAEQNGDEWCVLPPQNGHPHPQIGYRLYQFNPDIPPDEYGERWIIIQIGANVVLSGMANRLNATNREQEALQERLFRPLDQPRLGTLPKIEE